MVVSASTLAAVGEVAEVEALGAISVKDKAEPVEAHVLHALA